MEALNLLVQQGKALYIGISSYSGAATNEAAGICKARGYSPVTIHQPYYNMLSPGIEADLLPYSRLYGAGVIAFCPLAGGTLSDRYLEGLPPDSRQGKRGEAGKTWWREQKEKGTWDRLGQLSALAKERGQTMAQMALAWTVRLPGVTSALIGASSVEQVRENVAALENLAFTDDELARIGTVTRAWP